MYPNLEYILKKRYVVRIILRGSVLLLFMLGTIEIVSKLLQVLLGGPFFDEGILSYASLWPQMMFSSVAEAGKFMLPGLLILISQKGLVQLIVPFPKSECPRCDYALAKLKQPRCPECGLKLSAEFLQEEDDSDA